MSGQSGSCAFCTNDKLLDAAGDPLGVYQWEFQNSRNGRWYDIRDRALRWTNGRMVRLEIATDITERKLLEEQVRQLAFYDELTKLPNRRLLTDRWSQTMSTIKRSGHHAALLFLDLDNFKPLNDSHGHDAGDLLLVEVARRIKACVREVDTVARFGGDEFVVVLSELFAERARSAEAAVVVAEKTRLALAEPYLVSVKRAGQLATIEHRCTVSIGVVVLINHEASLDDILRRADAAMYRAKAAGRNLFTPPTWRTERAR